MDSVEVDFSEAPVVVVTFNQKPTDDELESFFDLMETRARSLPGIYVVANTLNVDGTPSASERKKMSEHQQRMRDILKDKPFVEFVAVSSSAVRLVLTALNWFVKRESHSFESVEEALDAARARALDDGLR